MGSTGSLGVGIWKDLVLHAPYPMIVADGKGYIIALNYLFTERYGYVVEDIATPEKWWSSAYPDPERRAFVKEGWERAAMAAHATGEPLEAQEWDFTTKDGELRWARFSLAPRGDFGIIAIHDITEERRLAAESRAVQERLRRADKLESLGVMAGGIAHDFNNLLTAVIGYVDLATGEVPASSKVATYLEEIRGVGERAVHLSRQMLAYTGRGQLVTEPVDMVGLIEAVVAEVEQGVTVGCEIELSCPEGCPVIDGDPAQLGALLRSLLNNAIEALTEGGGRVHIRTSVDFCDETRLRHAIPGRDLTPGKYLVVTVFDDGCGMTKEVAERVFDPFFTTKFTGRGLGLSTALGTIRSHNGAIELVSVEGEGTEIRVLLPLVDRATVEARAVSARAEWRGHGVVLVVDDEDVIRRLVSRLLARIGFETIEARDGREALALFEAHASEIVCVLLDLTMPNMGGWECLPRLRQIRPETPVVLMSGYDEGEVFKGNEHVDLAGFLAKPFERQALREVLRCVLEPDA